MNPSTESYLTNIGECIPVELLMILLVPGDDQPQAPQLEAIQILMHAGTDLSLKNEWGETALSLGLASKFEEVRAFFNKIDKSPSKK